jgi:hypothetical protein
LFWCLARLGGLALPTFVVLVVGRVDVLVIPMYQAKALPGRSCRCRQRRHPWVSSSSLEALLWYSWATLGDPLDESPILVVWMDDDEVRTSISS